MIIANKNWRKHMYNLSDETDIRELALITKATKGSHDLHSSKGQVSFNSFMYQQMHIQLYISLFIWLNLWKGTVINKSKLKHSYVLFQECCCFINCPEQTFTLTANKKRSSKSWKDIVPPLKMQESLLPVLWMLPWYSQSSGLQSSIHFHQVHRAAAILS